MICVCLFFNAIIKICCILFFLLFVVYLMLCKGRVGECCCFFFLCCTRICYDLFVLMHAFFIARVSL